MVSENKDDEWWRSPNSFLHAEFWILPVFEILRDTEGFKAFVASKGEDPDQSIFAGMKFLLRVLTREYLLSFERETFLGLTDDKKTQRAFFVGMPHEKIPPTSEKANVSKNLARMFQELYRSSTWEVLKNNMDTIHSMFISPLYTVFTAGIEVDPKLSGKVDKNDLLRYVGMSYLWTHGHNIDRIVHLRLTRWDKDLLNDPRIARDRKTADYYFSGYRLGLAYLWHSLLGKETTATIDRILSTKTWEELDVVSTSMRETLEQLEKNTGISLASPLLFSLQGVPDKGLFGALTATPLPPKLSLNEKIDEALLWYQYEIIDSARSKIFSGSSTFISLLHGEIMERQMHDIDDKLEIIRFKHSGTPTWFSYGLLMERFGSLSDFSGWLIFLDVGGDYAGLGGTEYALTETALKYYNRRGRLNVTEFEVDLKSLKGFFIHKTRHALSGIEHGQGFSDIARFRIDELEKLITLSLARALELVTKSFYEERGYEARIYYDEREVLRDNREIDVLAIDHKTKQIVVVECSLGLPIRALDEFLKEINDKLENVRSNPEFKDFKTFEKAFVTSAATLAGIRTLKSVRRKFEQAGIRIVTIEDTIIPNLPRRFRREDLLAIFGAHKPSYLLELEED